MISLKRTNISWYDIIYQPLMNSRAQQASCTRRYESKGEVMEELYNFNGETRGKKQSIVEPGRWYCQEKLPHHF